MTPHRPPAIALRTAAVWGTTVLSVRSLRAGESLKLGDEVDAASVKPDGSLISDLPVRAVGNGWELDARGATGGEVYLRGRKEDPAALARSGAAIPIIAGDYGLVQYGSFSIFFQFTEATPILRTRRRLDLPLILSYVFATVAAVGGLLMIWAITSPPAIPKPLELTSPTELAKRFNVDLESLQTEPTQAGKEAGSGPKEKVKEPKPSGGKRAQGAEGKLGRRGAKAAETRQVGEPPALGGMAEVLSSDVGEEVRKTLDTISSVADALGGLRSDQVVLGKGTGSGLRGTGNGGGGVEPGVPFGAGTLDTGLGAGRGGPGAGTGGPGGRGLGGTGRGAGVGDGEGDGERRVAGKDAPAAGQGLSMEQIRRVVMSRVGTFRACYEAAQAREPTLKGTVGVSFSVSPGGSVASANISNSTLKNARVEGCILRSFNRLRFPTADKATGASFPFVFAPAKK